MTHAQTIALYQPLLQRIAYNIVGCIADAEDIVQDTFLKWLSIDQSTIQDTKAYLVRAVTNNCLNHLKALNNKKKEYLDNIDSDALIERFKEMELFNFDIENEVSSALAVIHKKLEPLEKAIYILREVFDFEYDDLQHLFNRKKENCRQLFCRAKEKLSSEKLRFSVDLSRQLSIFESFKEACVRGQVSDIITELTSDIRGKISSFK